MKIHHKSKLAVSVLTVLSVGSSLSVSAEEQVDQLSTDVDLSFRYRVELVDQEGPLKKAKASTLKTRATVKTNWTSGFDSVIEFDDVTVVGLDDYNAGMGNTPEKSEYAVVADPEGTEVNQAFIRYQKDQLNAAYGRQRILIGNQRFVGSVGWRQNEQTYDSFTFNGELADNVDLSVAHVYRANRIFGENVPAGRHDHNTNLVNLVYETPANGQLSAFYLQVDNETALSLSNSTFGIRYAGSVNTFAYALEYASQSDAGDNPNNYSADYYLLEAAYKQKDYSVGIGYEALGGDVAGGQGFTTSLATLHKFQGWADVFLATPVAGIEDWNINASFQLSDFKFKAVYHDFSTEESSVDLGSEIDFSVATKVNKNLAVLLKYADFNSDNESLYASRDKLWLMFTYKI